MEVCLSAKSSISREEIKRIVKDFLIENKEKFQHLSQNEMLNEIFYSGAGEKEEILRENVKYIKFCSNPSFYDLSALSYKIFIFQLNKNEIIEDFDTVGDEEITTNHQLILPVLFYFQII